MNSNLQQCQFCNQVTTHEEHEQECLLNPQRKSCLTCIHKKSETYLYNGQYKNQYTCDYSVRKPFVTTGEVVVSCGYHDSQPIPTYTYNKYQEENIIQPIHSSLDIKG